MSTLSILSQISIYYLYKYYWEWVLYHLLDLLSPHVLKLLIRWVIYFRIVWMGGGMVDHVVVVLEEREVWLGVVVLLLVLGRILEVVLGYLLNGMVYVLWNLPIVILRLAMRIMVNMRQVRLLRLKYVRWLDQCRISSFLVSLYSIVITTVILLHIEEIYIWSSYRLIVGCWKRGVS